MSRKTSVDLEPEASIVTTTFLAAELTTIASTAVAYAVTLVMVSNGYAVEANPFVQMVATLGWSVAGLVGGVVLAAIYWVLIKLATRQYGLAIGPGWFIPIGSVVDATWNLWIVTRSVVKVSPVAVVEPLAVTVVTPHWSA